MNETTPTSDSPQVIAPPPFIFLSGIVVGVILNLVKPAPFIPENLTLPLGVALIIVAVFLVATAIRAFRKAGTNVDVRKPAIHIVANGPYRLTRNPIYLSMVILVLGITVWVNTLWMLALLVPVLLIVQLGVIKREEAYLERKFGQDYLTYKAKVRRWL